MKAIELLAPAKDKHIGMQAILHGADAVYIGGPQYGARSAVGNSVEDIAELCRFAHLYRARVYVTLNTILYNDELGEAEKLIHRLYEAGVDALITQDLGLLEMNLPPIALHASTQMDNRSVEDVEHRMSEGFTRVVLARELPLSTIKDIANRCQVDIEAFVHGALCVSYSGRCYASQYCFGRSANRGQCAQFCRLSFDLINQRGETLEADKHLLSLRDMKRIEYLEKMMDAGVMSFKIEGRLKDEKYVKNVVSAYRLAIDEIFARRPNEFKRASEGVHTYDFVPHLHRTFNREYTSYFLMDDREVIYNPNSPKSFGEYLGTVKHVHRNKVKVDYASNLSARPMAGDGICYISPLTEKQEGIRVNSVEGDELFLNTPNNPLRVGMDLWRNFDIDFDRILSRPTAKRLLPIRLGFSATALGFLITAKAYDDTVVSHEIIAEKVLAKTSGTDNIRKQLAKLGNTPFVATDIDVDLDADYFIPASVLNEGRRMLMDKLERHLIKQHQREIPGIPSHDQHRLGYHTTSDDNISNRLSQQYYKNHGATVDALAFELDASHTQVLMTCKHCILRHTERCRKVSKRADEQLFLRLPDGNTFPLKFNCGKCEMQVLKPIRETNNKQGEF